MAGAAALDEEIGRIELRWRSSRDAGDGADVGGDILGVLAGDEVGGHIDVGVVGHSLLDHAGVRDLLLDDALDGVVVHSVGASLCKRGIEVGTDLGRGAGLCQGVTGAAFLLKQRPAALEIGVLGDVAAGDAESSDGADREQRRSDPARELATESRTHGHLAPILSGRWARPPRRLGHRIELEPICTCRRKRL